MKHQYHNGCETGDCGGMCPLCCLSVCKVCNLYEGGLTTECPGVPSTEKGDAVYAGNIDFINGEWKVLN